MRGGLEASRSCVRGAFGRWRCGPRRPQRSRCRLGAVCTVWPFGLVSRRDQAVGEGVLGVRGCLSGPVVRKEGRAWYGPRYGWVREGGWNRWSSSRRSKRNRDSGQILPRFCRDQDDAWHLAWPIFKSSEVLGLLTFLCREAQGTTVYSLYTRRSAFACRAARDA